MNEAAHRNTADVPQLRTLLLTDLCDSTTLVERMGDRAAAELFREHDALVLRLQQQWRGRLIDRSDGLLLLFERPIDGLGFALDYERGVEALGRTRHLSLRARAGLHVGEVLTWQNSDAAVRLGAKPLEVEGLAKPMAARLMSMARPGQILLSAVAEPLAHRAARELGERGQHLIWKSLGRWRFKGVPESQYIFEVGEPGIAPLRAPRNTPKAWRDIPLWRRPAALVAEVALLAVVGIGVWFVARPQPAIAFNQRDWVVVADLRNLTGQTVLDDSLQQAFRISLEQSRYVNVLSDLKARDTLKQMQRPGATLDRVTASEVALRTGVRAVVLPTVAEVGGRVRVSAEVIDPGTQATVYAETVDGQGIESTLGSIDKVTGALRGKLGEALASIENDSRPLPEVTTGNLDALRAYALGQKAYSQAKFDEALQFYVRATELDPQFALAWLGQTRVRVSLVDVASSLPSLHKARQLRARLSTREAMYLDAWEAELEQPAQALDKWRQLASMYPDYMPANGNAGNQLLALNRYEDALPFIRRTTVPQNDLLPAAYDRMGRILLGMNHFAPAQQAFDQALAHGFKSTLRRRAAVDAAQRRFQLAADRLHQAPPTDIFPYFERIGLQIDRAQWAQARDDAKSALRLASSEAGFVGLVFRVPAAVTNWIAGDRNAALADTREATRLALASLRKGGSHVEAQADAGVALSAALVAQRLGDGNAARQVLDEVSGRSAVMSAPLIAELAAVVKAEDARRLGQADVAIRLLEPLRTGHEQYQTRVALQEAYADAGRLEQALAQSRWLQDNRGLAYIELGVGQSLQALNIADSNLAVLREAELLQRAGQRKEAMEALKRFDQAWPAEALPAQVSERREALLEASRSGVV